MKAAGCSLRVPRCAALACGSISPGPGLRKRFCRTFNFELQAAATDNGLLLSLSDQAFFHQRVQLPVPALREHLLTQALLDSPMFGARWKWNASRALAVPRFMGGRKVPPPIQRMRADDLLAAVFPDQAACAENLAGEIRIPDHPLVNETIANCLHEAMDLDGLIHILERMDEGSLRTVAIDTPEPSPFCHEILNANPYAYLDDAPIEERRARAVQACYRRKMPRYRRWTRRRSHGVAEESWPVARDADEPYDALLTSDSAAPSRSGGNGENSNAPDAPGRSMVSGLLRRELNGFKMSAQQRGLDGFDRSCDGAKQIVCHCR